MSDIVDGKILRKYEMVKKVGKGAYGQVWKVFDKQNKSVCALKKVFDAFRNPMDCQRTYREIMFLKELKHSCIIRLLNYHQSTNEKDMYLCLEFMESDLSNTLKYSPCYIGISFWKIFTNSIFSLKLQVLSITCILATLSIVISNHPIYWLIPIVMQSYVILALSDR